jgi:hypothetical protein
MKSFRKVEFLLGKWFTFWNGNFGMWHHVSYSSRPHLSSKVGSGAATCPMALDCTSRLRWAPTLSCVLWLQTSPLSWDGLQRCHMSRGSGSCLPTGRALGRHASYGPLWTAGFKHNEKPSRTACVARPAYSQRTHAHFQGAWHQGHHESARHVGRQHSQCLQGMRTGGYSTAPALWTSRLAPLQCTVTRQHGDTLLAECSVVGDKTRHVHTAKGIIFYS